MMALMVIPTFGQGEPAKPPVAPFAIGIQIMTDTEGVDLTPFMKQLYKSVRERAVATMPKSVALGDQGRVTISFQVQKDGSLVTALVSPAVPRVLESSGKKTLDDHAMAAIKSAAPFDRLPNSLSAQSIELKLTFFYNSRPLPH
jgi:TonB family protein